jgi:hypothetical protein
MKAIKIFFAIMLIINVMASCLYDKPPVEPVVTTPPNATPTTTTPSTGTGNTTGSGTPSTTITCTQPVVTNTKDSACFNTQILPFFVSNCAKSGCHDSKTKEDGYDLSNFKSILSKGIDLKNPKNSKIYMAMLDNMPPKPAAKLLKAETDLVLKWISEGAKNVTCGVVVDTANVSFSKTINPLLQTNCVGCHKTGAVSGGVLLDTYANVKLYVDNKKIWGAMNYSVGYFPMPPSQKLTDCQLSVVKKWIDKGAKND